MIYFNRILKQKSFLLVTVFISLFLSVKAQDEYFDLPEFKLPLTDKKLVIAHCMTHIISYNGHPMEDGCNPEFYPITNNLSAPIGGLTQVNVMSDPYMKDSSLEHAVEFEMLAAKRLGIDGFQFYYTLENKGWDEIIKAYFKVADEKNIDFKLTFCFSHPRVEGKDENMKLVEFASRVKGIQDAVGKNNKHWLRTPDGRLIVYLWYGEQIADIPVEMEGRSPEYFAARAYSKLANAVGEKFACMYSVNEKVSNSQIHKLLDYFPSVWMWTQAYTFEGLDSKIASISKKRGRQYTVSAFPDFYTSKVLRPGTWDMLNSAKEAVVAGKKGIERKYMVTGLSETFRKQWEFAIKEDVSMVNIITWNDYPEGHHFAPEINHNYGFSVLLTYLKSVWQGTKSPYADRDVAIAFFKKYKKDVKPDPFNIKVETLGKTTQTNFEDSIEVVTILPEAGQLVVNGTTVNVPSGLTSTRFKHQPGAVKVAVMRNGIVTKQFATPEWITDKPLRTDRITYSYDTEFNNFHKDLFGDKPPMYSTQYNEEVSEKEKSAQR
ncbi:MAG: endo-1,3-alpha-glucanase family glycosylhydrolase [Bacteroidota bacterium]